MIITPEGDEATRLLNQLTEAAHNHGKAISKGGEAFDFLLKQLGDYFIALDQLQTNEGKVTKIFEKSNEGKKIAVDKNIEMVKTLIAIHGATMQTDLGIVDLEKTLLRLQNASDKLAGTGTVWLDNLILKNGEAMVALGQVSQALGSMASSYADIQMAQIEKSRNEELANAQSIKNETRRQKEVERINDKQEAPDPKKEYIDKITG